MKKTLMAAALAFCAGVWAEDTARVTVPGGASTDYATLQAALDACTGGETVTMLADMTLTSRVMINTDVTLDLDGHALVMTAYADFLSFSNNVTATICGGGTVEVRTARTLITVREGTTVNVTNCTLKGYCMFHGDNATGSLNVMADTVAHVDYLISGSASSRLNIYAGHVAVKSNWKTGNYQVNTDVNITGGFFTRDPSFTGMMNSECGVMGASETLDGTTFTCKVVPKGEITYRARVTTSGGASTDYATLQAALDACTGGETVTMLASEEITSQLSIDASVEIDLANLSIKRTSGDFILVGYYSGSACTVTFRNGKVIGATGSCLKPWNSSVINVTNCVVTGSYGVYGASVGTVNILEDTLISFTYLAAGNSSVTTLLNVRGGYVNYTTSVRSSGNGATIKLYGGYTRAAPDGILADGCRYVYKLVSRDRIDFYHQVMNAEEVAAQGGIEAEIGIVGFLKLYTALEQVRNNETVCMVKDVTAPWTLMTQVGRSFTFDLGGHCLSRGGDVLTVMTNGIVRLRNGVILENNGSASCIGMRNGATLVVESTARIEGASGRNTNGIYMPGDNARVVFDGAQIATSALYSWGTAPNSTIEITGDSVMTCSRFQFSGNATLPPRVVATGGSFSISPTSYVTNNHVVLYRANASPCKWQVKPWAAICSDGWTFDLPTEAATVTGTCAAPSAGPITVSLAGTIPTRKTLLADLTGLTFSSGGYADLSFVRDASLPASIQVSYESGRLYAWEMKGTLIVFH